MTRTNEKTTPLHTINDINVKVAYFLIKESKLVRCTVPIGPEGWLHAKVKTDLYEFTEVFEEDNKSVDVQMQRLYINDKLIGELLDVAFAEAESGLILKCNVCIASP